MYINTIDDSELIRLLELLSANGFDVGHYDATGFGGELTSIRLTVYPRKTDGSKDEGNKDHD